MCVNFVGKFEMSETGFEMQETEKYDGTNNGTPENESAEVEDSSIEDDRNVDAK